MMDDALWNPPCYMSQLQWAMRANLTLLPSISQMVRLQHECLLCQGCSAEEVDSLGKKESTTAKPLSAAHTANLDCPLQNCLRI